MIFRPQIKASSQMKQRDVLYKQPCAQDYEDTTEESETESSEEDSADESDETDEEHEGFVDVLGNGGVRGAT